jgi:hypothetical protein
MFKTMKILVIIVFSTFISTGCEDNKKITKESCKEIGKTYHVKEVLNLRTGEKEKRAECK